LDWCNGWTFWRYEDAGKLKPIDVIRQVARDGMAVAVAG
jgi:modification methylase